MKIFNETQKCIRCQCDQAESIFSLGQRLIEIPCKTDRGACGSMPHEHG